MKHFALLFSLSFATLYLAAQAPDSQPSNIFEMLTATEGAELTLETDLTTFIGQKRTNNYLPGTLSAKDGKSYAVEIRPRGRFRRKVSQIPPMKIRFSGKELRADNLDSLNEIKIALPCFLTDEGDQLIVKEYLIYRMFEKLSDAHFRARLVRLNLRDTNEKSTGAKKMYAILVEDEEDVAARLGGVPEEEFGIPAENMDQQQAALVAMFQYLIGNTDWDFSMHRNLQLIRLKDSDKILPLPYDFDFSGLVSAPYASPSSESGLRTVRDRYLMAGGLDADSLKAANQLLKSKEKELYEICRSKFIPRSAGKSMVKYLGTYFRNMEGKDEAPLTMKME